jgi:hypothetical protein
MATGTPQLLSSTKLAEVVGMIEPDTFKVELYL